MSADFDLRLHELLFDVRRSIRYHNRRRMFFDRFNLAANSVALIFGSATVYGVLSHAGQWLALGAAAFVTVFSALNLVVGSSRMARLHSNLARRFIALEKDICAAEALDEAGLRTSTVARLDIEAEEPPVLRVLDTLCHNELARAMGYGTAQMKRVKWYQRALAQFFDCRAHAIADGA